MNQEDTETDLQKPKLHTDVELEFKEEDLTEIAISDSNLEESDKQTARAKRNAKREAKNYRTPEEKKRHLRKKLYIALVAALIVVAGLFLVPNTRWPLLNTLGFRGDFVMTVEEQSTKKPVAGVVVKFAGKAEAISDEWGRATFKQVELGTKKVTTQKAGYGETSQTFVNKLGTTKVTTNIKVIGIKLDLDIKDWLSSGPILGATVTFSNANATSDKDGRASIVIPPTDSKKIELEVSAPGYITKTVQAETAVLSREVALVDAQKNYFVSKRDGKFDIFSSNLDGTNQQKIIEATGKEDGSLIQMSIHKNNKQAVLVSNRDGKVQGGRVVAGVYLLDLDKASLKKIDEGSEIQIMDWSDNTVAYTKTNAALPYDDPNVSSVVSYNTSNSKLTTIAQANYIKDSLVAQNKVFYVPADAFRSIENGVLTSYDLSTGAKKTYLAGRQLNYISRASYAAIEIQDTLGTNHEIQIASGAIKQIDKSPSTSLRFLLSPNNQQLIWSDRRDGQGALLTKAVKDPTERVVVRAGGLTNPIRYVSDSIAVVRVATSEETADYAVHIQTGKIGKIVDVSSLSMAGIPGL